MAEAGNNYSIRKVDGKVIRWNPCQKEITYKVNVKKAGNKKKERFARKEIKRAFRKTASVTGFKFTYKGNTKNIPTGGSWYNKQNANSEIVVAYAKRTKGKYYSSFLNNPRASGVGTVLYLTGGSPKVTVAGRGSIVLNANRTKRMPRGFGSGVRRGNVLLHEIGHVFALKHVKNSSQLMSPVIDNNTRNGFQWGDRAGLRKVGKNNPCIKGASSFFSGS